MASSRWAGPTLVLLITRLGTGTLREGPLASLGPQTLSIIVGLGS